ncbi:bifunctional UDP-N-acetylglucosamine diphosphorylase/glucosamine-1-phosphate N-acetyltransferase GlmU [uncultured Pseudokineococcus sp.]|uniref:bifunctional UDP-N-acetylglucosamine diphosphorylase/glucosamine-1-phosphate N-acetyltransferase GlmU n=1 Tax=uncultured Pseudokineococcus sp. TaxID=1642928 RepID=UPI0026083A73|nr:bifunctional UDP-N-acetylglucosamine diphosphorylase/glucosamine-1-phosphate N-acetyltransferase GlmU [uncultured Pseudokineococcus sp.]
MSSPRPAAVVVLAAGEGTRMRSALPKVLHPLGGRSLLGHALVAARGADPERLVVVVRHERERVAAEARAVDADVVVAEQDDVPGTGRAVACALDALVAASGAEPSGTVLVTCGDAPLLQPGTLRDLAAAHAAAGSAVTVLTAVLEDAAGYGRVLRGADGGVERIVEQKDATEAERAVTEVNSGVYAFDAAVLASALARVGRDNAQGEVYLTDVLALARADGLAVSAVPVDDVAQTEGVNDRVQLARAGAELNRRVLEGWMRAGVTVVDPATTWVDVDVELAPDVRLEPGVQLLGATRVAGGAVVGPDATLRDCVVGAGASVVRTHGSGAEVGEGASVGPFSFLRPGTRLGPEGRIGAYVETKNAVIGRGSKVPHLTYVGDAEIGEGSNIGAATVFVNYDGVAKHRSRVGDHVRIGSDTMLVAPVVVGDGAYTAAGSVIDADVPPGAIAVARARQRTIEGWVERRRAGSPSAEAAARARSAREDAAGETPSDTTNDTTGDTSGDAR